MDSLCLVKGLSAGLDSRLVGVSPVLLARSGPVVCGICLAALGLAASGCGLIEVERAERAAVEAAERIADYAPRAPQDGRFEKLVVTERPWLGISVAEAAGGDPLPAELLEEEAIALPLQGPQEDETLAARIEDVSGLSVRLVGPVSSGGAEFIANTSDGLTGGAGVWSGPLDRLLNGWSGAKGYVWKYDGKAKTIDVVRWVSRTFRVNALLGNQQWQVATSTTGGGGGDGTSGSNVQSIKTQLQLDAWTEVSEQLLAISGRDAELSFSKVGAEVLARGVPGAVERVRQRLERLNRTILRPVTLGFHIYRVSYERDANYNLDLRGALNRVLGSSARVEFTGGGIVVRHRSAGVGPRNNALDATVEALHEVGTTSRMLSVEISSLNGRPAQFYRLSDKAYLKRIRTVTTDSGATSQEYEPGTVSWGIAISYLAQIVAPDEVLARLSVNISDQPQIRKFPESVSANQLQIQLPDDYSRRAISSTQAIRTDETLVLTGFADRSSSGSRSSPVDAGFAPLPWGGISGGTDRSEQVLLVTVQIGRPLGISEVGTERQLASAPANAERDG